MSQTHVCALHLQNYFVHHDQKLNLKKVNPVKFAILIIYHLANQINCFKSCTNLQLIGLILGQHMSCFNGRKLIFQFVLVVCHLRQVWRNRMKFIFKLIKRTDIESNITGNNEGSKVIHVTMFTLLSAIDNCPSAQLPTLSATVRTSRSSLSRSILTDFNSFISTSFKRSCSSWAALTAYNKKAIYTSLNYIHLLWSV